MEEICPKRDLPLHVQAENILRKLIEEPEYKNGKVLPDEVTLSQQLGISRNTLRQAINKLVYEGLLVRKRRVGTKVVRKGLVSRMKNWRSFSQEMRGDCRLFRDGGGRPETLPCLGTGEGQYQLSVRLLYFLF